MRVGVILSGLVLTLASGAAAWACPRHPPAMDGPYAVAAPDRYGPGPGDELSPPDVWEDSEGGLYMHGRRAPVCDCAPPPPPCPCDDEGLVLGGGFFDGAGGVGPIPEGGYQGGAYYIAYGGSASQAFASASAHSSARVSVRYRGGYGGGKRH